MNRTQLISSNEHYFDFYYKIIVIIKKRITYISSENIFSMLRKV